MLYRTIKSEELNSICKKMSILLRSGCEINKSLNILENHEGIKSKKIINQIRRNLEKGNSLTESFHKTKMFPKFFVNMINVGEKSGNLDEIMEDLAEYYIKEKQIKRKIETSLMYPKLLMLAMISSYIFISFFIMPNFENMYSMNGIEISGINEVIMNTSRIIRESPLKLFILILIILLIAIYLVTSKNKNIVYIKSKMKFIIPYYKKFNILIITTKISRSLFILIKSGINIIDAIDISSKIIDNIIVENKLEDVKKNLEKGNSISEAMNNVSIFPNTFIYMIETGEESGSLDNVLKITEEFYMQELKDMLEEFTKKLEPALTMIIGLVMGVFMLIMVTPMYDVINAF